MSNSYSIFFYEGYVSVAPTIINLAKSLNDSGHYVTIYATENPFDKLEKIGDKTTIIYFRKAFDIPLILKTLKILYKLKIETIIPIIEIVCFIIHYFIHIIKNKKFKGLKDDISIGVDTNGSILALIKSYFFRKNFIYLSLELNDPLLLQKFAKIVNALEQLAYRKAEGVIVQDEDRFKTLCEYNYYQHSKVFYLPNSASSSDSLLQNTQSPNYFRELLHLSEEEFPYIILQVGWIDETTFLKLAQAFASTNKGYALVFHERLKREIDDPLIKSLREVNSKNLFLSLNPLPYEQISRVYESATIGLIFYSDINNNLSQISRASGKLSYFLKHGKPVLVENLNSLYELVEKYKIGLVVNDPSNLLEIESAIEIILSNYSYYSENAKNCFSEEFDFAKKVKPILSFLEKA
jgi:glycosyltransferase involved in cell wall biosynthesis